MNEEQFEKERRRRDFVDEFFNCVCGANLLGKNIDYDNHLKNDCPVYKEACKKFNSYKIPKKK